MIDYQAEAAKLQNAVLDAAATGDIAVLKEAFIATNLMCLENRKEFFSTLAYKALHVSIQNDQPEAVRFLKDKIRDQKLQPFLRKEDEVIRLMKYTDNPLSLEDAIAAQKMSKEEAALVTELATGTLAAMDKLDKALDVRLAFMDAQNKRDFALKFSKLTIWAQRKKRELCWRNMA